MKLKVQIFTALFVAVTMLSACGGNQAQSGSSEESASAVEATTPAETGPVDTKAKSDSKGIGKFTSVEVGPIDAGMAEKGEAIFCQQMCCLPPDFRRKSGWSRLKGNNRKTYTGMDHEYDHKSGRNDEERPGSESFI